MKSSFPRECFAALPDDFFNKNQPLLVSRAPGRLDVMSGAADFSGSLCVQAPIAQASWCALQSQSQDEIRIFAFDNFHAHRAPNFFRIASQQLTQLSFAQLKAHCSNLSSTHIAPLAALLALRDGDFVAAQQIAKTGAALLLASDIAPRAGLASTGSAVVASVLAWCGMFKIVLTTQQQLALSAQVHANLTCDSTPDGSDLSQVAAALFARESQLQVFDPQTMQRTFVALPDDVTLYGFTCSEYHQNSDDVYRKARCATFMGRRILRDLIPHEMRANDDNLHLANVSVDVWRALRDLIPAKMRGRDFLQQFGDHKDERTEIESETEYSIRLAAEHPIYENARTERFVALLRAAQNNPVAREPLLIAAGELMIQSHCSYDHRYALRSPETNLAVELCRKHGARQGIPGAKLTGRNIGGTVAVLCDKRKNPDIETLLQQIICKYEKQTGKTAQLLTGSSPGALEWNASGVRETNLRELQS